MKFVEASHRFSEEGLAEFEAQRQARQAQGLKLASPDAPIYKDVPDWQPRSPLRPSKLELLRESWRQVPIHRRLAYIASVPAVAAVLYTLANTQLPVPVR